MTAEDAVRTDDITLRDEVVDVDAARRRAAELEAAGPAGDAERVVWLRRLGDLDAAADLGWRVLADHGGPATPTALGELPLDAVAPALRLAHVLQWRRELPAAERLFRSALAAAAVGDGPRAASLVAFGQQHLGKCLFDQGRDQEALACFEQALAMRRAAGAPPDQVASSEQAVRAARRRLAAGTAVSERRSTPS